MDDQPSLLDLAGLFAILSLASFGGATALVPELQRQVVEARAWLDPSTFAGLFAVAQAAPGPNVLFVSLIGWSLAGLPGLLVATGAILAPSSLVAFAFGRFIRSKAGGGRTAAALAGLSPLGVGLVLASGIVLARMVSTDALGMILCAAGAAWVLLTRFNPVWMILAGAVVGLIAR